MNLKMHSVIALGIGRAWLALVALPAAAQEGALRSGSWVVQIESEHESGESRKSYCVAPAQRIESFAHDLGYFFGACDKNVLVRDARRYQVRTRCTRPLPLQVTETFALQDDATMDGRIDVAIGGHDGSSLVTARWVNAVCTEEDAPLDPGQRKESPTESNGETLHGECVEPPPLPPEFQPHSACGPSWLRTRRLRGGIDEIR